MKKNLLASICFLYIAFSLAAKPTHQLAKIIQHYGDYTEIKSDSDRIVLLQQRDITRFFKNPSDQIQLFNDSLAILRNSLHGELSIINLNSNKIVTSFFPDDSSLIDHLITITPVAKNIIDSNLRYFRRAGRKLPIDNPLSLSTYFYDGKYIWVGASLFLSEPGDDFNGQPAQYVIQHSFLFQFDNSLKKINKIYALPNPVSRYGFWPDLYNFSMLDSNTVYLKTYSENNDTLLASYSLNSINNQLTLQKVYRIKYPLELPKKDENGNQTEYGICVENGFDNQDIYVFSRGLDIFKINDLDQVNLSPQLFNWSKTDTINSILAYHNLKSEQQAFVVLYNSPVNEPEEFIMSKVNTNRKLYYCFIDKNYNPIENRPFALTNNGYLVTELPDGTIQLITEDNGEYLLKIYKIY
jgi:hypothetical protein